MNPNPASASPFRVGLTGGIASGKSTVADMFEGLGATIIDTDIVARDVVAPGEPALDAIRHEFGDELVDSDGALDRAAMRRIIFSDEDARARLEAILHPLIRERTQALAATAGGDYQVIVVPLLVESPLKDFVDRIVVVDCDEKAQIQRLMARDAESEGQARRILAVQSSREQRLEIADDIVSNNGDLTATLEQVEKLHRDYLARSRQRRSQRAGDAGDDPVAN